MAVPLDLQAEVLSMSPEPRMAGIDLLQPSYDGNCSGGYA